MTVLDATGLAQGQRVRLPGRADILVIQDVVPAAGGGCTLYVAPEVDPDDITRVPLTAGEAAGLQVLQADGRADPRQVLAGLWNEWMRHSVASAKATALASTPLRAYPHQTLAVYGSMLPQPVLRFLLADEPGTGKTIMAGMWLREAQRLGLAKRVLVVAPANLVTKWQEDFERFFDGQLRRITAETIRQDGLSTPHDTWVVSLHLAAQNVAVQEAIHPDRYPWDAVIFDEAHNLTPTARTFHQVAEMVASKTPHALFMTATPHRGDEWTFRRLLNLVDPSVFPAIAKPPEPRGDKQSTVQLGAVKPGSLHFLRRMKEQLVDYDERRRLFEPREAVNVKVNLDNREGHYYEQAIALVDAFYPVKARGLAKMVYGKRAASSLWALAETLRRRRDKMGTGAPVTGPDDTPEADDPDAQEAKVVAETSLDRTEERKQIKTILDQLDAYLASDQLTVSKWPRMTADCLELNGIGPGRGNQVVVFTEFLDTATWLVDRFNGAGFSARRYSGADSNADRDQVRREFMAGGFEVLVSTDAGNEGIDMQAAHVLVNWDIPWSLVRLEQRMGRVHRIGQNRKVLLYNVLATGTREQDAHASLLDKLMAAANDLDGKMFDSLSVIAEKVLGGAADAEKIEEMLCLFYEKGDSYMPYNELKGIEVDDIRRIRDEHFENYKYLQSSLDMDEAVASLHDDYLERINPFIVERYLRRLQAAELVSLEKSARADEGLWFLSLTSAVAHELPASFKQPTAGEKHLVATRADAIGEGSVVMLGPGDPAFGDLIRDTIRPTLAGALWQGGSLIDRHSTGDYELHVYEVVITEGDSTINAQEGQRPLRERSKTLGYLIRADSSGVRPVNWSTLPVVEVPQTTGGAPKHPQYGNAPEAAAAQAADAEVEARRSALETWVSRLRTQLNRLPHDLTQDIADHQERVSQRDAIKQSVSTRLATLQAACVVNRSTTRRIGWAHVTGTAQPDPDVTPESERVSMNLVTALLSDQGWQVEDVSTEGRGYDLHARRGRELRCVEVKGRTGSAASSGVSLTDNEFIQAAQHGSNYWLYVVDHCADGTGKLFGAWQDPVAVFTDTAKPVNMLRIPGSALTEAKNHPQDGEVP